MNIIETIICVFFGILMFLVLIVAFYSLITEAMNKKKNNEKSEENDITC